MPPQLPLQTGQPNSHAPRALPPWVRYGLAVAATLVSVLITIPLAPFLSPTLLIFFYPAVVFSAWWGGLGPALLSGVLSILATEYFFVPPLFGFSGDLSEALRVVAFLLSSLAIGILANSRREVMGSLAEQSHWLRVTLESIGDAVLTTDAQGRVTFLNPVAESLTGWTRSEAVGQPIERVLDIIKEQTRAPVASPVAKVLREHRVVGLANHTILRSRDGREVPLDDSGAPIVDDRGRLIGVVLIFRDATALREAENKLAYQAGLLSEVQDAIIGQDENLRIAYWNSAAEHMFGWPAEETLGWDADQMARTAMPSTTCEQALAELKEKGHYEGEMRLRRKDDLYIDVNVRSTALRGPSGEFRGVVSSLRNITDRKRIERERVELLFREQNARTQAEDNAERLARLQAVTAALSGAITPRQVTQVILNQGLSALKARAGGVNLLTAEGDEIEVVDYVGYAESVSEGYRRHPVTTSFPTAEAIRTGAPIWIESSRELVERYPAAGPFVEGAQDGAFAAIPFRSGERTVGSLGIQFAGDRVLSTEERRFAVTLAEQCGQALERARLYEAEQQARAKAETAVRLRDHFFHVAAHELRNPLATMMGYSDLLARPEGLKDPERTRRGLRSVHAQTVRLDKLIGALLDVSRIAEGKFSLQRAPFDLSPMVARVVEEFRAIRSGKYVIEINLPGEPVIVNGDELRIEQVLRNLIGNAIKYTPHGGLIKVAVEPRGDQARVSVSDCGIGIPAGALPHLFQRFYRAPNAEAQHIPGLGIGLFVIHEIVSQHGGTIDVKSVEGHGTTFTIDLPMEE